MICPDREEHCSFATLDMNGKCIAYCSKNRLEDGYYIDCTGTRSEKMEEYTDRMNAQRRLH